MRQRVPGVSVYDLLRRVSLAGRDLNVQVRQAYARLHTSAGDAAFADESMF